LFIIQKAFATLMGLIAGFYGFSFGKTAPVVLANNGKGNND